MSVRVQRGLSPWITYGSTSSPVPSLMPAPGGVRSRRCSAGRSDFSASSTRPPRRRRRNRAHRAGRRRRASARARSRTARRARTGGSARTGPACRYPRGHAPPVPADRADRALIFVPVISVALQPAPVQPRHAPWARVETAAPVSIPGESIPAAPRRAAVRWGRAAGISADPTASVSAVAPPPGVSRSSERDLIARGSRPPAPDGPFALTMRLHAPREAVVTGDWTPPPITRGVS